MGVLVGVDSDHEFDSLSDLVHANTFARTGYCSSQATGGQTGASGNEETHQLKGTRRHYNGQSSEASFLAPRRQD